MKALLLGLIFTASTFAAPVKISGLDAMKVSYKAETKTFIPRSTEHKRDSRDNYITSITVGPLSKIQFDLIAQAFPGTSNKPQYKENATYNLTSFLPATIKALDGLQFKTIEEKFTWPDVSTVPQEDRTVEIDELERFLFSETPLFTFTNCWTTVYEFLRTWKMKPPFDLDVTWLGRPKATQVLMKEYTTKVLKGKPLQFGDVIVFSIMDKDADMILIQHAAVYILPGLYFEKTDSTDDDAIRFVLESDLLSKYNSIFGKKLKKDHYRLKKDARIPRLSETNNLVEYGDLYARLFSPQDLRTITFEFDYETGLGGMSRPVTNPLRHHAIKVLPSGVLDPKASIFKNFTSPKF